MNVSNTKNVILQGIRACPGIVQGKVFIIENPGTYVIFPDNHIMVTKYTTPLLALAILKCKGIITEQGGITSHAATIARELGIPCIVSCKSAIEKLSNEMEVILDGTKGCVYG
jgi:pyruvate,water dikinase